MAPPKVGSKYEALHRYLRRQTQPEIDLSFARIEALLDDSLPSSAKAGRAFWSNRRRGLQGSAWLDAGYRVDRVDLDGRRVFFRRKGSVPETRRGGIRGWDAATVRALREHLRMNQSELAEVLGVRQQTISEWEGGVYRPTRSRSKHLDLVAERAEFPYRPSRKR